MISEDEKGQVVRLPTVAALAQDEDLVGRRWLSSEGSVAVDVGPDVGTPAAGAGSANPSA